MAAPQRKLLAPDRVVRPLSHAGGGSRLDARDLERLQDLERLARLDPAQAVAQLAEFNDPATRGLALGAIGSGWGDADPISAARWLEGLDTEDEQVAAALGLIPVWAGRRAEEALDWSLGRTQDSNLRELSLLEVADVWASAVPELAMARFLALPSEAGTERGLHAISTQWALDSPDHAIRYFAALDPAGRRDEFLEAALVSLTNENPELAWAEARRVNDPERVAHIQSQALEGIAESRPADALRLAETDGNRQLNFLGIARGWATWDAQAAATWAATLEDENLRQVLLKEIRQYAEEPEPPVWDEASPE